MPTTYPAKFRRKIPRADRGRQAESEIAHELGITAQTVHNWRKQDRVAEDLNQGTSTSESDVLTPARKGD